MTEKQLMKGNEAIGEAAIRAGCRFFFGYPITPQNELPAYMSRRLPEVDGTYLQAESELAAINMVYGAAGAGVRVMTSSSSPGISLKMEGISYLAGAELPAVIVNIMRGGPGLGGIQPAQSDYFQATRGGGHGDYRLLVLAPSSIQEAVDLTGEAFYLADKYRNPVLILGDGILGQMMEPVVFPEFDFPSLPAKDWATDGASGREKNIINSLYLDPGKLEQHNQHLQGKYQQMSREELRYQQEGSEEPEVLLVSYGTTARICQSAIEELGSLGIEAALFRPISLYPFPYLQLREAVAGVSLVLVVEMSAGQMLEDVRLAVEGRALVEFYGRMGGMVPFPGEIVERVRQLEVEEL